MKEKTQIEKILDIFNKDYKVKYHSKEILLEYEKRNPEWTIKTKQETIDACLNDHSIETYFLGGYSIKKERHFTRIDKSTYKLLNKDKLMGNNNFEKLIFIFAKKYNKFDSKNLFKFLIDSNIRKKNGESYKQIRNNMNSVLDKYTLDTGKWNNKKDKNNIYFKKERNGKTNNWEFIIEKEFQNKIKKITFNEKDPESGESSNGKSSGRDQKAVEASKILFYKDESKCNRCKKSQNELWDGNFKYIELHHKKKFSEKKIKMEFYSLDEIKVHYEFLCPNCHKIAGMENDNSIF